MRQKKHRNRDFESLVGLSDQLASTRLRSSRVRVRQAELKHKRERVTLIPDEPAALSRAEFTERINRLADQLRENRRRIDRIRRARMREVGALLGKEFAYNEIVEMTDELSFYATYVGRND